MLFFIITQSYNQWCLGGAIESLPDGYNVCSMLRDKAGELSKRFVFAQRGVILWAGFSFRGKPPWNARPVN